MIDPRSAIAVVSIEAQSTQARQDPAFFPALCEASAPRHSHLLPQERVEGKAEPPVQSEGPYAYVPVLLPDKGIGTNLRYGVGAAQQDKTVNITIRYITISADLLAQRVLLCDGRSCRHPASMDDVLHAYRREILLYVGELPGADRQSQPLKTNTLTIPITFAVVPRDVSAKEAARMSKATGGAPVWYFENAWVILEKDGSATLLRSSDKTNRPFVEPSFFAVASRTWTYRALGLSKADQEAFQKAFPGTKVGEDRGVPYVSLPEPMSLDRLLEYSNSLGKAGFVLAGVDGRSLRPTVHQRR
jgi:hypothetical protein